MNAITLLKKDHRKVSELLGQGDSTTERAVKTRQKILMQLKEELVLHEKLEETLLYPRLKKFEATRDLAFEAFEEHALMDHLLSALDQEEYNAEEWTAKFTVLKEVIEHHVEEEENELFPKVMKVMSEEELKDMGMEMEKMKAEAQSSSMLGDD